VNDHNTYEDSNEKDNTSNDVNIDLENTSTVHPTGDSMTSDTYDSGDEGKVTKDNMMINRKSDNTLTVHPIGDRVDYSNKVIDINNDTPTVHPVGDSADHSDTVSDRNNDHSNYALC
jgi:hypothetical protein